MRPPTGKLEKVLVFGRSNSGKSSVWSAIAEWTADTGGGKIYLGDTDQAWDAMQSDNVLEVVVPTYISDYMSAVEWARGLRKEVEKEDWVVFDMADRSWVWSQEHYWNAVSDTDDMLLGDVYARDQLARKKAEVLKAGGKWEGDEGESMAGSHGSNWGVIYKYYHGLINTD